MTYEVGALEYEEFPKSEEPVWILGVQYSALYDLDDIKDDIKSRLWFTYRRGFSPIGGTGPTTDTGWGCMLRCGQMMLAQALLNRHLTRGWKWQPQRYDPKYQEILRLFLDKKGSCYSIHQIASMGASEGKSVGMWFGPNTIAQVLKKLAVYDDWTSLVIHVAMDNTVIKEDIKQLCKCISVLESNKESSKRHRRKSNDKMKNSDNSSSDSVPSVHKIHNKDSDSIGKHAAKPSNCISSSNSVPGSRSWKPLLLIVPLRLGLSEINSVYISSLKTCFTFKQSVGIIGGKPNHAHWFIGSVDDELIYLDPHTTQPFVDMTSLGESDESFHCPVICRMKITNLDPSIALGFYCGTEAEFDDLCQSIQKFIIHGEKTPMFELQDIRPTHWPEFQPYVPVPAGADFTVLEDRQYDTDEEFELL